MGWLEAMRWVDGEDPKPPLQVGDDVEAELAEEDELQAPDAADSSE